MEFIVDCPKCTRKVEVTKIKFNKTGFSVYYKCPTHGRGIWNFRQHTIQKNLNLEEMMFRNILDSEYLGE